MTIEFVVLVNKQGETRLSYYLHPISLEARAALESEAARKCMHRRQGDCSCVEHLHYKLIYRRYASLYFIVGVDSGTRQTTALGYDAHQENDLAIMEFIQAVMECFNTYFENACELDLMYNSEKAYFILEEMLTNGRVGEMNERNILQSLFAMDAETPSLP
ncbi:Clathrin adaptor complex small chain [Novymonas esmeraldas]|uniref:AP complex subunit sigma n=1 Tax=Novymonas esmeraldas TaxID=1808958 RepID=A0AAW0F1D6_9TRYP